MSGDYAAAQKKPLEFEARKAAKDPVSTEKAVAALNQFNVKLATVEKVG